MKDKAPKDPQDFRVDDPQAAWENFLTTAKKAITTPKPQKAAKTAKPDTEDPTPHP